MNLPENFEVRETVNDTGCFFYSVAQGLKQLKPENYFTARSLRLVCKSFAENELGNDQSWLKKALSSEKEQIEEYIPRIEFTADDIDEMSEAAQILGLTSPIWGRSEIEGRIICAKYNVQLHVIEKYTVEEEEVWADQMVDNEGSRSVDTVDYDNEENTLHIVNKGDLHFKPILKIKDDEITAEDELFNSVRSTVNSEAEKLTWINRLFKMASKLDINFQGKNGDTCLHIAVQKKELQVIELLLKKGARTDIKNDWNESPLDVARRLKRQDIIKMLERDISNISEAEQKQLNQENDDDSNNKLTYRKRPGTSGISGQLYEIELIMLFLLQTVAKKEIININSFYLATNMQEVGDFDDAVFKYKYSDKGIEKSNIIFLQAKHKEAEKSEKRERGTTITIDTLLSQAEKGDFILRKYMSSYRKIKQLGLKKDPASGIFNEDLEHSDFVIYTNAEFNFKNMDDYGEMICLEPKDILHYKGNPANHYYKLKANDRVKDALERSLDYEVLVRELAESIKSGNIDLNKHIFKDYHVSLAEKVIQVSKENKKEGKIKDSFLNDEQNKELRSALFEKIKNNNKNDSGKSDDQLKEDLNKKKFNLPENFGVADKDNFNFPLPDKLFACDEIEKFLTELKLFFKQPNVTTLRTDIRKLIKDVFNLNEEYDIDLIFAYVHNEVMKWWREDKMPTYLTEQDRLFNKAKDNLSIMKFVGLTILQGERIKSIGLSFKDDQIQRLSKLMNEKRILNIISKRGAILLSTIKVCQALEGKSYTEYIFMSVSWLINLQKKVLDTFLNGKMNLLVIECGVNNEDTGNLYNELFNIIKYNLSKKIVLITYENDHLADKFKNQFSSYSQYGEEIDKENSLTDLENESQEVLLNKKQILFQGVNVNVGSIVDCESKHLIAAEVLCKLVNDEEVEVDKEPDGLGEVKYYYIDRTFQRQKNINMKSMKEKNIQDIYVVSNVTEEALSAIVGGKKVRKFKDNDPNKENPIRFIVLDDEESVHENLKQLYEKYKTYNIHWLRKDSDKFIWQESYGCLKNLRKFVDTQDINEYPGNNVTDITDRVVIVSAEPGMGKSVILIGLATSTKELDPSLWVIRINLNDCTKQLDKMNLKTINLNETINFLSKKMGLESPLEKELFKHRLEKQGKIALLFDGFDEISPYYTDKVIALIKILKETKVDKLWITTRPHMRNELEDELSLLSYTLKPLYIEDQKRFLKRFWDTKLDLKIDADDYRLNTYIGELLTMWSNSIADKERNFTGIPLQTRMLAEVYQDQFQEFYNSHQLTPNFPAKIDLLDLYQSFINQKYDIYWLEKNKADPTNPGSKEVYEKDRKKVMLLHQLLGLKLIFSDKELKSLLSKKKLAKLNKYITTGHERTGIIIQTINGTLNFVHRTFAECFAAFWLADNRGKKKVKEFLRDKLFESKNRVLRDFFDRILAKSEKNKDANEILTAVLNYNIKKVKELSSLLRKQVVDKGGRTALHLAAAYGFSDAVKVLLSNDAIGIRTRDKVFGWRPLSYADKGSHWHAAELLLERGANGNDMLEVVKNINLKNSKGETLLHTAAKEGLIEFTKFLIQKGANIDAKTQSSMTPLHYAIKRGNLDVAKLLIEKGIDINCQNKNGDTALHYAADGGNLDAVKFLMEEKADLNILSKNGDSVLHYAAREGNLDVVKCLVEHKAKLNIKNNNGDTALNYSEKYGNKNVEKYLIEHRADSYCENDNSNTVVRDTREITYRTTLRRSVIQRIRNFIRH